MAQTMFLRMLPESLRTEVYRRPELKKLELMRLKDWVRHQTLQERSEELAAQLMRPERISALTAEQKQIASLQQQVSALQGGGQAPPKRTPTRTGDRTRTRRPRQIDPLVREFKAVSIVELQTTRGLRTPGLERPVAPSSKLS